MKHELTVKELGLHALLSPSSAHRWLVCTPSARLEQLVPDGTSEEASEGTLAHELCATLLDPEQAVVEHYELYDEDMKYYASMYYDYVKKHSGGAGRIHVEVPVNLTDYIPEGFGTVDCVIEPPEEGGDLHIVDFKYGKGVPVSAEGNTQLWIYALGVLSSLGPLPPTYGVYMTIFQPRINNVSRAYVDLCTLGEWGEKVLRPIAQLAYEGKGVFDPGDHCRFCRALPYCKAQKDASAKVIALSDNTPDALTADQIAEVLKDEPKVTKFLSSLKDYALSNMLNGIKVPGFKVVEGRSTRVITNYDALVGAIIERIDPDADPESLYERKALTITALEKRFGKKAFAEVAEGYIDKPQGKPALAPEDDKKPAMELPNEAQQIINQLNL